MAKRVFKYVLELKPRDVINIHGGAKFLAVQVQYGGIPVVWALVDDRRELQLRAIDIVATGQEANVDPDGYIGTFQVEEGRLVFHVFDGGRVTH